MTLPKGFHFDKATNADIPAIKTLINQVLKEFGLWSIDNNSDTDLNDIEDNYRNCYFGLIKTQNNKIIATFALFKLSQSSVELRKMYLLPEFRSKGIGKWMIHFLIQEAKDLGYKKLELQTASVLQSAIAIYKKIGFDEVTSSSASPRCDRAFEMYL